mmetsp:Transcript_15164/g.23786  ORF Transcript_15164/g.23786 Transcript_15164/m.23786 type:complete len:240 (+) Transcript_15164:828-1547(+)
MTLQLGVVVVCVLLFVRFGLFGLIRFNMQIRRIGTSLFHRRWRLLIVVNMSLCRFFGLLSDQHVLEISHHFVECIQLFLELIQQRLDVLAFIIPCIASQHIQMIRQYIMRRQISERFDKSLPVCRAELCRLLKRSGFGMIDRIQQISKQQSIAKLVLILILCAVVSHIVSDHFIPFNMLHPLSIHRIHAHFLDTFVLLFALRGFRVFIVFHFRMIAGSRSTLRGNSSEPQYLLRYIDVL